MDMPLKTVTYPLSAKTAKPKRNVIARQLAKTASFFRYPILGPDRFGMPWKIPLEMFKQPTLHVLCLRCNRQNCHVVVWVGFLFVFGGGKT